MQQKSSRTENKTHPFLWLTAGILLVSCLIVIVLFLLVVDINRRAETLFGEPSAKLSPFQKLQYSQKLLSHQSALELPVGPGTSPFFKVESGESIDSVAQRLQAEGWISDAGALRDYLVYSGLDTSLQSGEFELESYMSPIQIAHKLQDTTPDVVTFTILAGWRLEEIAASLPTSGLEFSADEFLHAARSPLSTLPIVENLPNSSGLEGFLFPDRYRLNRNTSSKEFFETVLANFDQKVNHQMRKNYEQRGLSLYDAVILASIIQREAVIEDEMPMIASVFLNRLNAGIKLETDPTVQYALGFDPVTKNWWKNPLNLVDLQFVSPYNTYLHGGLPPAPIANPGLNALSAVAYPAQTPYFFFRSACDGSGRHNFSETFEQHNAYGCPSGGN